MNSPYEDLEMAFLDEAHKRRGRTDQAERYAFGIAGALRVEQELYGVADGPSTR